MNSFLMCITSGAGLLLSFLLFFHPLRENLMANKWLAFFVFIMSMAFLGIYLNTSPLPDSFQFVIKCIDSIQFILAPSLFLSTLFFVNPIKTFGKKDLLHFIPFLICAVLQIAVSDKNMDFMTVKLFDIGNASFLIRDLLPLQFLIYIALSYTTLIQHKKNLKMITASVRETDLSWLRYFLLILTVITFFWINDALFGQSFLLWITPMVYTGSLFFLAYFSIRQKTIFSFNKKELEEISELLETPLKKESLKPARLNDDQLSTYSNKLNTLMEQDRLFLDNDLSLPILANRLGISIHDTSYLINRLTNGNFYIFINRYRVEEAKKLLTSDQVKELNMLGIAFASGFNSKTAFNTAFKKQTGISPTAYSRLYKNQ